MRSPIRLRALVCGSLLTISEAGATSETPNKIRASIRRRSQRLARALDNSRMFIVILARFVPRACQPR